jgi:diguanylate cyclase (GGDEF)-like protein
VHPEDRAGWERAVRRARSGAVAETEYRMPRLDGTDRWLLGRRAGAIGPDGIERVHSSVQDISARKAAEEKMQETANRDPLTGLSNRRGFEYDFERTLAYASRYRRSGAILVVDLDGFKAVNDALGHQTGDDLLLGIAADLQDRLRDSDLIGRLGGDEFVVVLAEVSAEEAARVAGELCVLVHEQGLATSGEHVVTASIGVAHFDGTSDQRVLLDRADQAMYDAKRGGGDQVAVATDAPPA